MQEKDKKIPFSFLYAEKEKKNAFTLYLQVVQSKVVFDPRPSFLFRSWVLDRPPPPASPGNNQNNVQLGSKKTEFQMKDEQGGL